MEKCKVLVVTHKEFDDSIVPAGYQVIKVGNKMDDKIALQKGYLLDSKGNNIASQNPWYCELTAQYWGWKNLSDADAHYIGICHYRRYFFDYQKKSTNMSQDILSERRIKEILSKYKVILSFETVKLPGYGYLYKNIPENKQDKHWIIMKHIFESDYPELMESFNEILYGKYTIWGNMLITTKDIYDKYCEWLFEVLGKYDNAISCRGEERIPRVDGFLSEYLLLIWFKHYYSKEDVYHLEVRNTETDDFEDYSDSLKGKIIKQIRKRHLCLVIARKIRIMFLLIKRKDNRR